MKKIKPLLHSATIAAALLLATSAAAQRNADAAEPAEPAPTPRLADGTVDLGGDGIWDQPWITDFGKQLVGIAEIPFLPWTKAMYEYNKSNQVAYDPQGFCLPPGGPRMFGTPYPSEFIQDRDRIVVIFEGGAHVWREIHMDGRPLPKREDLNPTYFGYSVGRWDGDTLVIETTNVTEWQAPRWPHSDAFRVTERWFLKDASEITITGLRPDRPPKVEGRLLINEMIMNDSKWYADTDYKVTVVYRRLEDQVMLEDGCAEGIWMEALERTAVPAPAATR